MKKQPVAISAVLSIGTELGPSEFSGKPSDKRIFSTPFPLVTASFSLGHRGKGHGVCAMLVEHGCGIIAVESPEGWHW
jgi:hypothetical protein